MDDDRVTSRYHYPTRRAEFAADRAAAALTSLLDEEYATPDAASSNLRRRHCPHRRPRRPRPPTPPAL